MTFSRGSWLLASRLGQLRDRQTLMGRSWWEVVGGHSIPRSPGLRTGALLLCPPERTDNLPAQCGPNTGIEGPLHLLLPAFYPPFRDSLSPAPPFLLFSPLVLLPSAFLPWASSSSLVLLPPLGLVLLLPVSSPQSSSVVLLPSSSLPWASTSISVIPSPLVLPILLSSSSPVPC